MVTVESLNVRVVAFPGRPSRGVVVAVAFAQTAVLLANRRKTASFTSLVHRVADPVDARVAADLPTNQITVRSGTR
jgi:hypothetical protein